MNLHSGWRLALRLARREALGAPGRSLLVLVMIALPVLAVSAASVIYRTQDVSSAESLDRRLGGATAEVTIQGTRVVQAPDPDVAQIASDEAMSPPLTADEVAALLGGARLVERRTTSPRFATHEGMGYVEATEIDLRDPVAKGLFDLTSGRLPENSGEVVVNAALAAKGYAVGDALDTPDASVPDPTIVGIAESTTVADYPVAAGPLGSLAASTEFATSWLVDGDPVSWAQVRALNAQGAVVLSRAVVLNPPPMPAEVREYAAQSSDELMAVVVLVVVMTVLEVVLLAGPAFAVGARRQARSLALMSAAGGTPAQSRRVVLAGALVLGSVAAVVGVVLGIGLARVLQPVLQARSGKWFGPFEVPWLLLSGIAGFGLLSALLAAIVPAWIASRQDVVAVLAGRRGDRRASRRSPLLGIAMLFVGVAGAAYGAAGPGSGELYIAGSAIVSVLGMILLIPGVLILGSTLSQRLPLALRYAVRDAARHRTRTVPAVAAVAATVAGVVALGIATSSDEAQNEATYTPSLPDGVGVVSGTGTEGAWSRVREMLEREIPTADVTPLRGATMEPSGWTDVRITAEGRAQPLMDRYGNALGSELLVSDEKLPSALLGVPAEARVAAERTLSAGGVVAFTTLEARAGSVRIRIRGTRYDADGRPQGIDVRATQPALVVPLELAGNGPQAVVSSVAAEELGVKIGTVGLAVDGAAISEQQEHDVNEALAALADTTSFYVERGYPFHAETPVQLILGALGAVLMLGGTLTATFLALSDARPDLATLSAVGASPRTRRGVAAAYALVVGMAGAVLGAVVGFVPGVAITYPLTRGQPVPGGAGASHYLDVPWLLVGGLVVALPLLTAAVVGLAARSRLPLVARLD